MEEWCHIPPIEIQTVVESMPRCIEAVLALGARCPVKTLNVAVSFVLAVTCVLLHALYKRLRNSPYCHAVSQNHSINMNSLHWLSTHFKLSMKVVGGCLIS